MFAHAEKTMPDASDRQDFISPFVRFVAPSLPDYVQ
jgi:hypothetical protein